MRPALEPARIAVGLLWLVMATTANAMPILRAVPVKPSATVLHASDRRDVIVLKLQEGTQARRQHGRIVGRGIDSTALESVLAAYGLAAAALSPLFVRTEADLDAERALAMRRSGRMLADLNLYYRVVVPPQVETAALCDALNRLPFVELAAPLPKPVPPPRPPLTPDFSDMQAYVGAAPHGIGVTDVATLPGADGAGIAVVDIEYSWRLDHEDLRLGMDTVLYPNSGTTADPFNNSEHGTSVLGELVGLDNGYGVTGLVPAALIGVVPSYTTEFGWDVGGAVSAATAVLDAGDVIVIEHQLCICNRSCDDSTQFGLGPVEDFPPWYDAISTATALGISVIEAAGNGAQTLDDPACNHIFDRTFRDSGAIIVGAGTSGTHARVETSSWGTRIDVQGWGENIVTTGYGDLFDPGDSRRRYTAEFAGTSGASPMVGAAAAIVQGVRRAAGLPPLSPVALRRLLTDTGTPQGSPAQHIGPLPNLRQALSGFVGPTPTATRRPTATATPAGTCGGDCDGSGTVTINELVAMVNIALGTQPVSACRSGDTDHSNSIEITELVAAVNRALAGC